MKTSLLNQSFYQYIQEMKKVPKVLYFRGDTSLLEQPMVSIVGTRKPSHYTKQMTADLAHKLTSVGVSVVSGGAMGVDGQAHFGAGYGQTIAVMPCGLDVRYPNVHKSMFEEIEKRGLLLSQFEDGAKATNWNFVIRNELVVALGDVLVVAEALRDSGSIRSVEYAQKMGKKIYTFAHRTGESDGTMDLVKSGDAEVIYDIEAFVNQYGKYKAIEKDAFLQYCIAHPNYDEVLKNRSEELSMYELEGKIRVDNGKIVVL